MNYLCGSVSDVWSIYFYLLSLERYIGTTVLVPLQPFHEMSGLIL
jgi:hypothetical protein